MSDEAARRTYVLIHGAWHGGWCYKRVRERLEHAGHRVFAPTLTGLGERSHLLDASTGLTTHIIDIVNTVLWEDLDDIIIVAHSYGSWVASGALEAIGTRVTSAVFVDCYLPEDGEKLVDFGRPESIAQLWAAKEAGELGRPAPSASEFGVVSDADRAWVDSKTTPQPVAASFEPISLSGARERVPSKVYVRAPAYVSPRFDTIWDRLGDDETWQLVRAPGGHDVMIDEPDFLADLLLTLAE